MQNAPNFTLDRMLRVYFNLYPSDQKKELPRVLFSFPSYFLDIYAHIFRHADTYCSSFFFSPYIKLLEFAYKSSQPTPELGPLQAKFWT